MTFHPRLVGLSQESKKARTNRDAERQIGYTIPSAKRDQVDILLEVFVWGMACGAGVVGGLWWLSGGL